MRGEEGEVVRRNSRVLMARSPLATFQRGGGEEHDATSGRLPCTGREDGGTMIKLHPGPLFTVQTDDVT
jgi:hypothetical protein